MSVWPELVTTALLGTGRRPVPNLTAATWTAAGDAVRRPDPAERVLDLAAAHASVARLRPLPECGAPAVGPPQKLPTAPPAARRLLEEMLQRPEPKLINIWLHAGIRYGFGLAPEHWAAVVRLAARSPHYDRDLLVTALGERGRWFVGQNPEWRRLDDDLGARGDQSASTEVRADTLDPAASDVPTLDAGTPNIASSDVATPDVEAIDAAPELIFDIPDPWSPAVVATAFRLLGGGRLGPRARSYAVGVGVRLSPTSYHSIGPAAEYYLEAPEAGPAIRRAVRTSFVALERAAFARLQVDRAFDPELVEVQRVRIPPV